MKVDWFQQRNKDVLYARLFPSRKTGAKISVNHRGCKKTRIPEAMIVLNDERPFLEAHENVIPRYYCSIVDVGLQEDDALNVLRKLEIIDRAEEESAAE